MGMKHESLAKWLKDGFIFEPVKRSGNADSLVDGSLMEKVFERRSLQMRNMQRAWEFANLLTPEEQTLRQKVRACVEKEIAPIMTKYWEKAEFPFQIVLKLGALNIVGGTTKSYGCHGLLVTTNALVTAEIGSVDASYISGL